MKIIKGKLDDAIFLWQNERRESAFLLVLICLIDLSIKRYPDENEVKEAFLKMFKDFKTNFYLEYRGEQVAIESIFFKYVKNKIDRERKYSFSLEFINDKDVEKILIIDGLHPEYILRIGVSWFSYLVHTIIDSQEFNLK